MKKSMKWIILLLLVAGALYWMPQETQPHERPLVILHGFNPTYSSRISLLTMHDLAAELRHDLGYGNLVEFDGNCQGITEESVIQVGYFPQGKLGEIPEYSNNLQEALDKITECSGAQRVDVVAHSMGGIVARYYTENMGGLNIDTLIMLGTPNHGGIYQGKGLFDVLTNKGESKLHLDFLQLSENHNFMQLMNQEARSQAQYYTIAGNIDGTGDGLIMASAVPMKSSQHLEVSCNHFFLKHPSRCPEAYNFVKQVLS